MKFLCVPCDQPMKLLEVAPPDRGSLNVLYECPECAHRIAMLTNPFETQLVSSLGVRMGPEGTPADASAQPKCPFSGMVAAAETEAREPETGMRWTDEATERMQKIPEFVRPMAKTGIEKFAQESGHAEVTVAVLEQAKSRFGM